MHAILKESKTAKGYSIPFEGEKHLASLVIIPFDMNTDYDLYLRLVTAVAEHEMVVVVIDPRVDEKIVAPFVGVNRHILRLETKRAKTRDTAPLFMTDTKNIIGFICDENRLGRDILLDLMIACGDADLIGAQNLEEKWCALRSFCSESFFLTKNLAVFKAETDREKAVREEILKGAKTAVYPEDALFDSYLSDSFALLPTSGVEKDREISAWLKEIVPEKEAIFIDTKEEKLRDLIAAIPYRENYPIEPEESEFLKKEVK